MLTEDLAETLERTVERIWTTARSDPMRAVADCRRAMDAFPGEDGLWSVLGRLLLKAGRVDDAAACLERALETGPDDAAARLGLAQSRLSQGRPATAVALLEAAPWWSGLLRGHGETLVSLLFAAGDFEAALDALTAPEMDFPDAEMLETVRAAAASERALGLTGPLKRAWIAGMEALTRGEPAAAEARFAEVTRRAPGYGPAWVGLRGAVIAQGRPDPGPAGAPDSVRPVLRRAFAGRGLPFDPREMAPFRPRAEVLSQAATSEELCAAGNAWLVVDEGGASLDLAPTLALGSQGDDFRETLETAEAAIAALDDALLVGRGWAIEASGVLVRELCTHASPDRFVLSRSDEGVVFDAAPFRNGACSCSVVDEPALLLSGPTDAAFGDWFVNFLPRLALARRAGVEAAVVVRRNAPPFVRRTLHFLGVPEDRIIEHDPASATVFRRLFVPTWPLPSRTSPTAGFLAGLEVEGARRPAGPRRVYLSRERMSERRLLNEGEVRARFEARGFQAVHPELLSLEEMHELLGAAQFVAGPYGSAFLNLAFCPARPSCLVLAPPYYRGFMREATLWLNAMNAPFGLFVGDGGPSAAGRGDPWMVDVEQLESAIDCLLDSRP